MKIERLRKRKGLTQTDLAEACGTSQQQIAKIEGGIVDPRLSTLRRIADALECEVGELFYSRKEFLSQLNQTIREHSLDVRKLKLIDLNSLCSQERKIPTFHPFWEEIYINNGKLSFEEK